MKRRHNMPFGAQILDDGRIRFRLWAPAAKRLTLILGEMDVIELPLARSDDGWFELITDAAQAGTRYSFVVDDNALRVPDPASRFQPQDVNGPSEVIDPASFEWQDYNWHGLPWEQAVSYELHIGAFTSSGTFSAVIDRLDYLVDLGVTCIELMPVSDFPGKRNWGYDGVYPFSPDSSYGRPEDLKQLVQSAHSRGLMVLLDVVYNHFGPEGNYLNLYAPQFFTKRHHTPWGNGINFDGAESRAVRDFFINNALYWLTEYHFDGLRLDAVHAIIDDSSPDILTELAGAVRSATEPGRQVHLILENDRNQSSYLTRSDVRCQPRRYTAQWNDDIHHSLHTLITGERDGYYVDYSHRPIEQLARCLTEGFAYQGEPSVLREGISRGESTKGLPLTAFVSFLQNHDQIGNRALGERITKLAEVRAIKAAAAILLLVPSSPMLFMGEEFGAETPFLFFCDFESELAAAVTEGRRNEFAHFTKFADPTERATIPDPNAYSTFEASQLNWSVLDQPRHQDSLNFYRQLLSLRKTYVVPRLAGACKITCECEVHGERGLNVGWKFADNSRISLLANLGDAPLSSFDSTASRVFYASEGVSRDELRRGTLPAWSVAWLLEP